MAITRTQIAKQLLEQGGRVGLQGGGADMGDKDRAQERADRGYGDTSGVDRSRTSDRQDYNTAIVTGQNPLGIDLSKGPPDLTPKEKEFNRLNNLSFAERFKINSLKNLYDQKFGFKKATPSFLSALNVFNPSLEVYEKSDPNLDDYGMSGEDLTDTDRLADAINKAQDTGNITQSEFENAFFGPDGRPEPPKDGDGGQTILPRTVVKAPSDVDQEPELTELQKLIANTPRYRFAAEGGIMNNDVVGGEYDFESARQMYGLGKLVKKVTRTVKKIAKSPVGKVAIAAGLAGMPFGGGKFFGSGSLFGKAKPFLTDAIFGKMKYSGPVEKGFGVRTGGLFDMIGGKVGAGILGASALSGLMTPKEEDEDEDQTAYRGEKLDIADIRSRPFEFTAPRFMAEGGDVEPVAKKTMPLIDMDGKEKDYRETGGFVDMGRMEKADDVPARLSKNEFVFTADAVRNAGDGSVDKGAEVMYNMMKNLEAGGDVSEESQGLEGARKMFQTSQRLEEVL